MACLQFLQEIQAASQQKWQNDDVFCADPRMDTKKFFTTFAMPYSNGNLHAGHGFSLSKSEFAAAYKRLQGYNVMFPQAFHASGTPIVSAAKRIQDGDVDQQKTLLDMGIDEADIQNFADPYHWIRTFVPLSRQSMIAMGCGIDWRRTFVTTDAQFQSFVQWQFGKLEQQGLLKKGEKIIVYSVTDGQPCSDHDRRIGEGIRPIQKSLLQCISEDTLYLKYADNRPVNDELVVLKMKTQQVITFRALAVSLQMQQTDISRDLQETKNLMPHDGWSVSNIEYWEPSEKVISRSGDICIVAKVPQWFIDYENEQWSRLTVDAIQSLSTYNPSVKKDLEDSVKRMQQWGCSRTRGIGTALPVDTDYIIDSLSDSTIYMAYYTVSHKVQHLAPLSATTWDSIFCDGRCEISPENPLSKQDIKELRDEFLYWFPLDLRASGKDLIPNHLALCLFNHVAIWDAKMSPRSFWCNGHLLLNAKKMAKSTGNFLTLQSAIDKWGADVVRMVFADAGDSIDDANFECAQADKLILRLAAELKWNATMLAQQDLRNGPLNLFDQWYVNVINATAKKCLDGFENMTYRVVMQNAWFGLLKARDTYRILVNNKLHKHCITSHVEFQAQYMCPITPHSCEYLWSQVLMQSGPVLTSKLALPVEVDSDEMREAEYLQVVVRLLAKKFKTGKMIKLSIASSPKAWMLSVLNQVLAGKADDDIIEDISKSEDCTLQESKRRILPLSKHLRSQDKPRFLNEYRIVSTHLELVAAAAKIHVQHILLESLHTVPIEKPKCVLTDISVSNT